MSHPRTLGLTWGDPNSPGTYSGVPYNLFREFHRRGWLAATVDCKLLRPSDFFFGIVDWKDSIQSWRPRMDKFWRFLPENVERLSKRLRAVQNSLPPHDALLQFGVAGIPDPALPLVAHIEIPLQTAINTPEYARGHSFDHAPARLIDRALEGEKMFFENCSLIWTNTEWTAGQLELAGVDRSRIRISPPGCGIPDPGIIERDWSNPVILFVGRFWERKGGDLLVSAFRNVRRAIPQARLLVVGCKPEIREEGVEVLGLLRKDVPQEAEQFERAFREATIFCMPSSWESTGIVYMEAAIYGLPMVMLRGQGRESVFPPEMAVHLGEGNQETLAEALLALCRDPDSMQAMGAAGRKHILENYTWDAVATKVYSFVCEAVQLTSPCPRVS